jgi:two-component system KDP operon response regulator KdpE
MARGPDILVIDEDPAVRRLLRRELTVAGYRVRDSEPGQAALATLAEYQFDLIILDIDSAAGGGPEILRTVRKVVKTPILALSVRIDEDATVRALDNGADDFVRKPFGSRELLARVRNARRRRARELGKPAQIVTGDLEIDLLHHRVRSRGQDVQLSAKPYEVLRMLAENAGQVLPHKKILGAVWGVRRSNRRPYLRMVIRELRRQLEADPAHPQYILSERGVGYRLEVRESAVF